MLFVMLCCLFCSKVLSFQHFIPLAIILNKSSNVNGNPFSSRRISKSQSLGSFSTVSEPPPDKALAAITPKEDVRQSSPPTSVTSSDGAVTAMTSSTTTAPARRALRADRLRRSVLAAYTCAGTWVLIRHFRLSAIQASSVQGILASLMFSQPMAGAAFCGSFAGMSGHLTSLSDAVFLGSACGIVYYLFESGRKIGVGYGGRLGTIAFLSNVLYIGLRSPSRLISALSTTVSQTTAYPLLLSIITTSWLVRRLTLNSTLRNGSQGEYREKKIKSIKSFEDAASRLTPILLRVILFALMASRIISTETTIPAASYACTTLSIFIGAMASKKFPGFVLPASVVGLVGSLVVPKFAAPIFLGAFIGMTAVKDYSTINFLFASSLSSFLFHLGILDGYGGKLGLLAFLGVNVGI